MVELVSTPLMMEEAASSLQSTLSALRAATVTPSDDASTSLSSALSSIATSSSGGIASSSSSSSSACLPIACTLCPKTFANQKLQQQHQHMFHTDKSFVCEICGKAFRFRSNLAEHRSVHTALKPYVCKFCGKSSRLKGNLTKHILKHHKREPGAEQVSKDDIIIKKEPSATELLDRSLSGLQQQQQQQQSPVGATTNGVAPLGEFVGMLPKEEKSSPDYERAIFLSFGFDQGSMDLTGVSPDGSSDNGTDPAGGSHDLDSEISGSPLATSTIGGASSLQALLAQVSSTPSTPPRSSMTPSLLPSVATPSSQNGSSAPPPLPPPPSASASAVVAARTQCNECGKHFRKVSALQLHMTLNHGCAPPASSVSSIDEKLETEQDHDMLAIHNDLRHVQSFMTEKFERLEQTVRTLDQRMCKMEKNVETVLNSMYSLVQLQTGLSANMSRFRDEMGDQWEKLKSVPSMPDV